jgi:hypothetical protein
VKILDLKRRAGHVQDVRRIAEIVFTNIARSFGGTCGEAGRSVKSYSRMQRKNVS